MFDNTHPLAAVQDVNFRDGGHMLAWTGSTIRALRIYEQLLLSAHMDVKAALSHQRWRWHDGEAPPRVRARLVALHLTGAATAVRAAIRGLELWQRQLNASYIEPARQAAREQSDEDKEAAEA